MLTNEFDDSDVNFSVTLYDDSEIQFHYGAGNTNLSPTVGISRGDDRFYILSAYDGASTLTSSDSVEFNLTREYSFTDIGAYEFQGEATTRRHPSCSDTEHRIDP